MLRVAIYMRVSTDRQALEGDSIPAQRKALLEYIDKREDYILEGTYVDDGISGQKFEQRDALQQMLSDVRERKIDIILFTKLDRFFRSVRHYAATQDLLDKYGVKWCAIWEPTYDTTTPMGQLMVNQMMSFAQFEAQNTSTRIKQVFEYKRSKGEVCTGMVPYGYEIRDKHLAPTDDSGNVAEIFTYFSRCGNLAETVRFANARFGCVKTSRALKFLLTNEKYIGRCRDVDGYCPALVSNDLWEDVQRKLRMGGRQPVKNIYIFSGLIRCKECGGKFTSYSGNRGIRYYRCRKHYGPLKVCQNGSYIREDTFEEYLLESIGDLIEKDMASYRTAEKTDLVKARQSLEGKLERLKNLYIDGDISRDEYRVKKEELLEQLGKIDVEEAPRDYTDLERVLELDIPSLYREFTEQERQYFWRSIIREVSCDKDKHLEVKFF